MLTFPKWLQVDPETLDLSKIGTRDRVGFQGKDLEREEGELLHQENINALRYLQFKMYAESKRSVLIVMQAMDTGGKDGAIRRCFGPLNPQGVRVFSYKKPTARELAHDYLWRVHQNAPEKGHIHVFNRSHYEDVLIVRVHNLVPPEVWGKRYHHIREFERLLADEGTIILKFMLHISKEEQRDRLQDRLDDPTRTWKFEKGDLHERKFWDDYQQAYEAALTKTTTDYAPWYVIPADRKWYRNYCISTITRKTLEQLDMNYPEPEEGLEGIVVE